MSRLLFNNIADANSLLELRREELAGYIMEHLHALGGNPLKEQYSHPNNLAISIVGHYPQSARDNVYKAIFSTCKWLIKKDYLAETNDQGFYEISELGTLIKLAADLPRTAVSSEPAGTLDVVQPEASALDQGLNDRPKVFISYSWKDKPLVRTLEADLRAAGAEVWVDHRGIRAGDNLPDEISNALRWCDTLLLIWSAASVDSYWVKLEWTNALSLKKKIIPCLVDRTELPSILSHKAYVEMSDLKVGIEQLLRGLQRSNHPKEQTPRLSRDDQDHQVIDGAFRTVGSKLGRHPRGLAPLSFFVWGERFNYYGIRAITILYMVAPLAQGGLGFDTNHAVLVYASYTIAIYFAALPGGLIADLLLGSKLTVLIGATLVACGDLMILLNSVTTFYVGLILMALGTGLLKPNITAMLGGLYPKNDLRRDSGFTIFYMSIYVGAILGPVVCGYFAQGKSFQDYMGSLGFNGWSGWRLAFGVASLGMIFGLLILLLNKSRLAEVGVRIKRLEEREHSSIRQLLNRQAWKGIGPITIVFIFAIVYWWAYEQTGSLFLAAEQLNRTEISGFYFPEPLGQLNSGKALFVIILAPLFSLLWIRLGERQPSSFGKLTLGLSVTSVAYLLLIPALSLTSIGKISQIWLVGVYLLDVAGELCVAPVALNIVTNFAPKRLTSTMVALLFLATMLGSILAGRVGSAELFTSNDSRALINLYGVIAAVLLASALVLAAITPRMQGFIGEFNKEELPVESKLNSVSS